MRPNSTIFCRYWKIATKSADYFWKTPYTKITIRGKSSDSSYEETTHVDLSQNSKFCPFLRSCFSKRCHQTRFQNCVTRNPFVLDSLLVQVVGLLLFCRITFSLYICQGQRIYSHRFVPKKN